MRYVILEITNREKLVSSSHSEFQKNRSTLACNILVIKMRGLCLDLIKTLITTFLLGENSGENHYMLLAVLLYEQKHSSLINYLNLLLLDEIPII